MPAKAMLQTHPDAAMMEERAPLLDALAQCIQSCSLCADACLAADDPGDMRDCIRTDLTCADICTATAAALARQPAGHGEVLRKLIATCETACRECAEECERHAATHEHCRLCAEACRLGESVCAAFSI